ncbi:MAG: c-type cytochrome [Polyangiaceae bacterium]|nr:c-type cytochrome [Polyangiaceae bacterium]
MNRGLCALLGSLAVAALAAGCRDRPRPGAAATASPSASAAPPPRWAPSERDAALSAGRAVLERHECTRCHKIDDLKEAARPLACTSCHVFLTGLRPGDRQYKSIADKYGEGVMKRYQRNIQHLVGSPDLSMIARRVRPSFLASFLAEPFDLRPTLEESMFRHALSPADVRAVVRYFAAKADAPDPETTPDEPPPPADPAKVAAGKALFLSRGCAACHTYGNLATGVTADALKKAGLAAALAPNLRFTRERTRLDVLVPWIVDPQRVAPGTLMPALGLSPDDAGAISQFLLHGDPELLPAAEPVEPAAPKVLAEHVGWETVKEQVLGKVCVHCHMNDYEKDPGPGNKGGLGYPGSGLSMRTYEALVAGVPAEGGKRVSVLQPRPGEALPRVLSAMLDRRREEPRDHVPAFADRPRPHYPKTLGMPLGLPSMNDREVSLVATWIAQGCPGPKAVTGMPGVDDGYLVPDGPIKKNQGCEARAPEAKRPSWAVDAAKP